MKSMINKKILTMKFRDFGINYDIPIKPEYITFMEKALNNEGFTDNDFVQAIDSIMRTNANMYGKMPNLAMFIENRKGQAMKEDVAELKTTTVMCWLSTNVNFWTNDYGDGKQHLSTAQKYDYRFEDNLINAVIEREYGNMKGLIERYSESKLAGYTGLFRQSLLSAFRLFEKFKQLPKIESGEKKIENEKIQNVLQNLNKKLTTT